VSRGIKSVYQHSREKHLARERGCDEDGAAFEERPRKIAKTPPPKPEKRKLQPKRGLS
jgi:hypothetical protein